jgi:antitoxin (DNA-binding transcriptional repressor) of toxin-antitoxin stability system
VKTVSLDSPQFSLEGLLREAAGGEVVFLTTDGRPRFALVAVDDSDQEAFSLRSNTEFMAYLDQCKQRARQGPTKSLQEIKRYFTDGPSLPGPPPASSEEHETEDDRQGA